VSPPVRFAPEASAELEDAVRWYEERRHGLGLAFLAAVANAVDLVTHWPETGEVVADLASNVDVRRVPVRRFPYHLAYLATEDVLHVLAVAHDRRRPAYWSGRVEA
jgi:toxin ParE1/3/4